MFLKCPPGQTRWWSLQQLTVVIGLTGCSPYGLSCAFFVFGFFSEKLSFCKELWLYHSGFSCWLFNAKPICEQMQTADSAYLSGITPSGAQIYMGGSWFHLFFSNISWCRTYPFLTQIHTAWSPEINHWLVAHPGVNNRNNWLIDHAINLFGCRYQR